MERTVTLQIDSTGLDQLQSKSEQLAFHLQEAQKLAKEIVELKVTIGLKFPLSGQLTYLEGQ